MSALAPPAGSLVVLTEDAEDLQGNVVEIWDFFERGDGPRKGAAALAGDDVPPPDTSS
jgi:hypothetical protein